MSKLHFLTLLLPAALATVAACSAPGGAVAADAVADGDETAEEDLASDTACAGGGSIPAEDGALAADSQGPDASPSDLAVDGMDADLTKVEADVAVAADTQLDGATADGQEPDGTDADVASCPSGLEIKSSHKTLVPPPVNVVVQASNPAAVCTWTSLTPAVCAVDATGTVTKVSDGNCQVSCAVGGKSCAKIDLLAKEQPVFYVVGGSCPLLDGPAGVACAASVLRYRVADGQWDTNVAMLPELRDKNPVVWSSGTSLYVTGGYSHGTKAGANWAGSFAPKCWEALEETLGLEGMEPTCREGRKLDLVTGEWSSIFKWLHPKFENEYVVLGSKILVSGTNGTTPPPLQAAEVIDTVSGQVVDLSYPATMEGLWPNQEQMAVWGDKVVVAGQSKLAFVSADLSTFGPLDLGWPCATNSVWEAFTFPVTQDLFIVGEPPPTKNCPAKYWGDPQTFVTYIEPMRYSGGLWQVAKPMQTFSGQILEVEGKLYMVGSAILRLDQPDGGWKLLSEAPVAKVSGGVAVVVQ